MKVLTVAASLAAILLLAFPTGSDSCSIAPPVPVFATTLRPADLSGAFLKGRIGVLRPSYARIYWIGAYRLLSGKPLSPEEAQALYLAPAPTRKGPDFSAADAWAQARGKVPGGGAPAFWNIFKSRNTNGSLLIYPNCLDDAFHSAIATLQQRAARWGANDPRLQAWAAAQDQVFQNCSGRNAVIPPPPDAGMDPLLAADRRYQIAAAYFYAADWQMARAAFQHVAEDQDSPWKSIAPYLIARTYIREGAIDENSDALRQAAGRLQMILDDPAARQWQEPARKLLDYVRLRIDPGPRLSELGAELAGSRPSPDLAQAAADFLYLYNRLSEKAATASDLAASSDLADWMLTFAGRAQGAGPHALAQWRKTRGPAWLIAALSLTSDPEALRAARATDPSAPEYESVTYYGILADPDRQDARAWADQALQRNLLLSSRNLILGERLALARTWNEFLRFAPRSPEPKLQLFDGQEVEVPSPPVATGAAPLFDTDSTAILNRMVPFALWSDASANSLLPAHLRLQVAESAWVRALVLGKDADARSLMQPIVRQRPAFAVPARDFLAAPDPAAARFSGVLLLLRTPGASSFLAPGEDAPDLTRTSDLGSISWGFAAGCAPHEPPPDPNPAFLDPAQQARNDAEWKQMADAAPSGGAWLAAQTLAWTNSHPQDPRLPEALHLVVQAGRRACRGLQPVEYGHAAFDLLHRRYPDSAWTRRTPYWYR